MHQPLSRDRYSLVHRLLDRSAHANLNKRTHVRILEHYEYVAKKIVNT